MATLADDEAVVGVDDDFAYIQAEANPWKPVTRWRVRRVSLRDGKSNALVDHPQANPRPFKTYLGGGYLFTAAQTETTEIVLRAPVATGAASVLKSQPVGTTPSILGLKAAGGGKVFLDTRPTDGCEGELGWIDPDGTLSRRRAPYGIDDCPLRLCEQPGICEGQSWRLPIAFSAAGNVAYMAGGTSVYAVEPDVDGGDVVACQCCGSGQFSKRAILREGLTCARERTLDETAILVGTPVDDLLVSGTDLFILGIEDRVERMDVLTKDVTTLATGTKPQLMLLTETHVLWFDTTGSKSASIHRVPRAGGTKETVTTIVTDFVYANVFRNTRSFLWQDGKKLRILTP